MRQAPLVWCVMALLIANGSQSRASATQVDSLKEVFLLRPVLCYSYEFADSADFDDDMTYSKTRRSGRIQYRIVDSTTSGDTAVVWSIQETHDYRVRHTKSPLIGPGSDTTLIFDDTVSLSLVEKLYGTHELQCKAVLWNFPLRHIWGQIPAPIYRYADSPSVLLGWSWLNPPGHDGYGGGTDTLEASSTTGFSARRYSEWWGSGYIRAHSAGNIKALSIPSAVESRTDGTPKMARLFQNFPNPFNPTTTIRYELPHSFEVNLSVYDLLGRQVSALVNERCDAGIHEAKFDGTGLSSGVYFYRLQAGSSIQMRRLVLLR